MKKLITICLLIATTIIANAQTKPTKEETIAYINKVLKSSIGYNSYTGEKNNRYSEKRITDYEFSSERIIINYKETRIENQKTYFCSETYSKISWESLTEIQEIPGNADWLDDELISVFVRFTEKVKYDAEWNGVEVGMEEKMYYPKTVSFTVLKTKSAGFRKALLRLSEIAKEENKDPFGN